VISFRLLPPLSPSFRARRLLALTLRDLRRLAARPTRRTRGVWEALMYSRLSAMPDAAEPLQRSQLVASLALGTEIIQLSHMASRLGFSADSDAAFAALARGNGAIACSHLAQLDHRLAARADTEPEAPLALRARASILAISDALNQHASFFDAGALR
jgi:Fusaric acid resistance protein family